MIITKFMRLYNRAVVSQAQALSRELRNPSGMLKGMMINFLVLVRYCLVTCLCNARGRNIFYVLLLMHI